MDRKKLIRYIYEKAQDCGIECRIDILNHIAGWRGNKILHFEGTGTRILFNELDTNFLEEIKNIIDIDLSKYKIDFGDIDIDDIIEDEEP
jgi:hypothetical protein